MRQIVAAEGIRSGLVIALLAVVFAVLGLSSSLTWIPEVPLLTAAFVIPVVILGLTGFRAASRSGLVRAGPLAGATAGFIGGAAGGLAYVFYGKAALNVIVGALAGASAGAVSGLLGALAAKRS